MKQTELAEIKKKILVRLLSSEELRYSDIAPKDVANDLFNYHLQHLVKLGYVAKTGDRYTLTLAGKQYVEVIKPLTPKGDTTDLFRVNILAILIKEVEGKRLVLNQTRKRHPYYDDRGIIGGAVRPGEMLEDACMRVLARETGLHATFRIIGVIRKIRYMPDGSLFSDIFYHVGLATDCSGDLVDRNEFGENYWVAYDEALHNESVSVQGGRSIVTVLEQLQGGRDIPFFYYQEKIVNAR